MWLQLRLTVQECWLDPSQTILREPEPRWIRPNLTSDRAQPRNLTDPISLGKLVGGGNQLFPLSTTLDLLSAFLTLQISFQVDFL